MSRRRASYTRASKVTVRKVGTDEALRVEEAYSPNQYQSVVRNGNKDANPENRARKRRQHIDNGRRA